MKSNITMNEKFFILTSNELFLLENLDIWKLSFEDLESTFYQILHEVPRYKYK